jgi:hypothetical protein
VMTREICKAFDNGPLMEESRLWASWAASICWKTCFEGRFTAPLRFDGPVFFRGQHGYPCQA